MKRRRDDFTLGLTLITMFALGLGVFFYIARGTLFSPRTRTYHITFKLDDGVVPLAAGSAVVLRGGGISIGKVRDVTLQAARDVPAGKQPLIIVTIEVEEGAMTLRKGTEFTTSAALLGGGGSVVVQNVGPPDAPELPAGATIAGKAPATLQAAIDELREWLLAENGFLPKIDKMFDPAREGSLAFKIDRSLTDVNALTRELVTQLSPAEAQSLLHKLHSVMDNINAVTAALRNETDPQVAASMLGRVHTILDRLDTSLVEVRDMLADARQPVHNTLANVENASHTVDRDLLTPLAAEFNRDNAASLLGKIHHNLDQIAEALSDIDVVSQTGKQMLVLNRPSIDRTFSNLNEASEQIKNLVSDILLNPWRLITPEKADRDRMQVFQAAQAFAQAASRLDDVSARLDALVKATPPDQRTAADQEEYQRLRAALKEAFDRFAEAEKFLYTSVK